MAEHKVVVTTPEMEVGKADVIIKVSRDNKVIGKMKVSKGGFEWVPYDKTHGHELKWLEFAELIEGYFKAKEGSKKN